jgi:hypothetical protein
MIKETKMDNKAIVNISRSTSKWWTITIEGISDDKTVDDQIRSFQEILRMGIKRVCLDLSQSNSEFTLVHRRTEDILQYAHRFQRVAVLVSNAKTAFSIKAAIREPEDSFRVFYQKEQLIKWLDE